MEKYFVIPTSDQKDFFEKQKHLLDRGFVWADGYKKLFDPWKKTQELQGFEDVYGIGFWISEETTNNVIFVCVSSQKIEKCKVVSSTDELITEYVNFMLLK